MRAINSNAARFVDQQAAPGACFDPITTSTPSAPFKAAVCHSGAFNHHKPRRVRCARERYSEAFRAGVMPNAWGA